MQVGVITNPNSRKNKGKADRAAHLQSIIGALGEVRQTPSPEAIKPVLRDFLRRKAQFWVSDGGDGALHWMLRMGQEVLQEEEFQGCSLPLALPTNGGSIDFVAHNVGIRGNAESILARLRTSLERGQQIEEVEVDSMAIDGVEVTPEGEVPFQTLGFAVAAGGVGQRFFGKLFEAGRHTSGVIASIVAKTVISYPVAYSPLRHLPGMPRLFREYARDLFKPTRARCTLDGEELPWTDCTGIHIASMSINLGGVLRFFKHAEVAGQLAAIVGAPTPYEIIRNVPRMHLGLKMVSDTVIDAPCREMTLEALGDELMGPIIDGEYYPNVRSIRFRVGPRVHIPKVVGRQPGLLQ
jgi:diacylglycerol kinase family enzyme